RVASVQLVDLDPNVDAGTEPEARAAGPVAAPECQPAQAAMLKASRTSRPADVRLRALLASFAQSFLSAELARVERRRHERPVAPAAADLAMYPGARLEPGRRDDERVDEG